MMMGMKMGSDIKAAWCLMMIGVINWGLIGIGGFLGHNWNVVFLLIGRWPQVEWLVYILVGVSGLYLMSKKHMMKS